jgi:hypothetical protein
MTPEDIAKSGTESSIQKALFAWCALNVGKYPELKWFHAIPNGGSRGDSVKSRAIRGMQLKAEGVKKGVSDCFLPVKRNDCSGLYIEMKKPGGKESVEQKEFGKFVIEQNFGYICCDSWEKAKDMLIMYLTCEF